MPQITSSLSEGKPIIAMAVAEAVPEPSAVRPSHEAQPFHILTYHALLDTGADITCVLPHVVSECHLVSWGLITMTGASGTYDHISYLIRLGVWCEELVDIDGESEVRRSLYHIPGYHIAAAIQRNSWFDLIIGMDIIAQHELTFLKGGRFRFTLG